MKPFVAFWGWTVCVVAGGCAMAPREGPALPYDGQELPILREQAGTHSSIDRRLRVVVHDAGTLATLPIDIGPVDFEREMVLLAAMGPTPSDDYYIRILRVHRRGGTLRAVVELGYPPYATPTRRTEASPFHAVVLPKCPLSVRGFTARLPRGAQRRRR